MTEIQEGSKTGEILGRCVGQWMGDPDFDECLVWTGETSRGYGRVWYQGKRTTIQRVIYSEAHGGIPDGLYIDHRCRVRRCANIDHLEAITNAENVMRGEGAAAQNSRKTHCVRGHEFTEENTRWEHLEGRAPRRVCRICKRAHRNRKRDAARSESAAGVMCRPTEGET